MSGSPPRMRGKLWVHAKFSIKRRITPADAGKTGNMNRVLQELKDHPRGCGENDGKWGPKSQAGGSPPRMRGKLIYSLFIVASLRITPADAGKTK